MGKSANSLGKSCLSTLFHGLSLGFILYFSIEGAKWITNYNSKTWVKKNLENVIEAQNENLGIEHRGVPEVEFGLKNNLSKRPFSIRKGEFINDTIYLKVDRTFTPENGFLDNLAKQLYSPSFNIKKTLDHELCHFYLSGIDRDSMSWDSIRSDKYSHSGWEILGAKMVEEGICRYFSRELNDVSDSRYEPYYFPDKEEYPSLMQTSLKNKHIYHGGYKLTNPVIEKFGIRGMKYLVRNPPNENDFEDLPKYRERVIDSLSKLD